MNILRDKIFAIVDVETTGTSPTFDRCIELGIIRVENGLVTERFQTLLDPQKNLPSSITTITGIQAEDLLGAPLFEDVSDKVSELLEGAVFVAHNARFDYSFMKNEFKRVGKTYSAKNLCTVRLSRKLFPGHKKHDLSTLIERFGFECENRHRALDDAEVLWSFLEKMDMERGMELEKSIAELLKENTLPQFLDETSIRVLPEGPGVYVFYGPEDEILYIGKSKNVRYRVLSHFSNDHATAKEMHLCQQTVRVYGIQTAGELSALLLESRMIKEHSPLYNRLLRRTHELVVARKTLDKGYERIELERIKGIEASEYSNILGIFKNVRQAKEFLKSAQDEHSLCPKLLGLETGKGACFYSQLQKCLGACTGKEASKEYNIRLKLAFKTRRMKAWPFSGPVLIEEKIDDERKHSFILDNWCLLKDIETTEDDTVERVHSASFDYDSYKIFVRYIKDPLYRKTITPLSRAVLSSLMYEEEMVVIE
ncbi:MAG: polC [Parcubacteria group bacterium]|nr:polC [Parcubacteria group bacterium]